MAFPLDPCEGRIEIAPPSPAKPAGETPARGGEGAPADRTIQRKPSLLIRALICTLLFILALGLVQLSRQVSRQRSHNETALNDLLGVMTALRELDGGGVLDFTARGPGPVPGLPGSRISAGTTLFVRRWKDGETYLRGTHDGGTLTYYFHDGSLHASEN